MQALANEFIPVTIAFATRVRNIPALTIDKRGCNSICRLSRPLPSHKSWVGPASKARHSQNPKAFSPRPTHVGQRSSYRAGMTPRKGRLRSYLTPLFGIGVATRQHPSDGCWSVTRMAKRTHRHFSAPISIWCRPTSSQPTQGGGK